MAEQPAFVGLREAGPGAELPRAAEIVEQGGGEQEVGAQPRVELRGLAASVATPTVCSSSPPA